LFAVTPITAGADGYLVYSVAAAYFAGVVFSDEKMQISSILATKSIVYSYLISHVVAKTLTGRQRPSNDLGSCTETSVQEGFTCNPYDFFNFHPVYFEANAYGTSMPSFHATMLFSVAKVYSEVYDNAIIPYSVLALLYASNIKGHNHWVSDLVAGAIIGTFIGDSMVRSFYEKEENVIAILPQMGGLRLSYNF